MLSNRYNQWYKILVEIQVALAWFWQDNGIRFRNRRIQLPLFDEILDHIRGWNAVGLDLYVDFIRSPIKSMRQSWLHTLKKLLSGYGDSCIQTQIVGGELFIWPSCEMKGLVFQVRSPPSWILSYYLVLFQMILDTTKPTWISDAMHTMIIQIQLGLADLGRNLRLMYSAEPHVNCHGEPTSIRCAKEKTKIIYTLSFHHIVS